MRFLFVFLGLLMFTSIQAQRKTVTDILVAKQAIVLNGDTLKVRILEVNGTPVGQPVNGVSLYQDTSSTGLNQLYYHDRSAFIPVGQDGNGILEGGNKDLQDNLYINAEGKVFDIVDAKRFYLESNTVDDVLAALVMGETTTGSNTIFLGMYDAISGHAINGVSIREGDFNANGDIHFFTTNLNNNIAQLGDAWVLQDPLSGKGEWEKRIGAKVAANGTQINNDTIEAGGELVKDILFEQNDKKVEFQGNVEVSTKEIILPDIAVVFGAGGTLADLFFNDQISGLINVGDRIKVEGDANVTANGIYEVVAITAGDEVQVEWGSTLFSPLTPTGETVSIVPTSRSSLSVDGDLYVGGSMIPSDERLKKQITRIKNPMAILSAIGGFEYLLRQNDERQLGVIAQKVEKVLPFAVKEHPTASHLTVNYTMLIPVLIEGMIEQNKKIEELEERMKLLESKL